jgi:hypothetical protein
MLRACLRKLDPLRHRRRVERALALHLRGEVRRDGLELVRWCNRLEVQWRARDIHPWDRDLPVDRKANLFVEQSMEDTETAIFRLFEAFPQVDVIDIRVLGPTAESLMIAGTVCRADLDSSHSTPSVRMRLRRLGVSYNFAESLLSPVDSYADRFS